MNSGLSPEYYAIFKKEKKKASAIFLKSIGNMLSLYKQLMEMRKKKPRQELFLLVCL